MTRQLKVLARVVAQNDQFIAYNLARHLIVVTYEVICEVILDR